MSRRQPWWVDQRWEVETMASIDSSRGLYKKGDWIVIYTSATKQEAEEDARRWKQETGQATRVVPGAGHKTRRSS